MMDLDLEDETLAGIAAFYSIVNIPQESLPLVFREMARVLQPNGQLANVCDFDRTDLVVRRDDVEGPIYRRFENLRARDVARRRVLPRKRSTAGD